MAFSTIGFGRHANLCAILITLLPCAVVCFAPVPSHLSSRTGGGGGGQYQTGRARGRIGGSFTRMAWWNPLKGSKVQAEGGDGGAAQGVGREEAKRQLLELVARSKRGGGRVAEADEDEIAVAMVRLEGMNPTSRPAESSLLSGKYSLLYTGSPDSLLRKKGEGVIGSAVTEITGASESSGPAPPSAVRQREVAQVGRMPDFYTRFSGLTADFG